MINLRDMEMEDLPFVLSVRNDESTRNHLKKDEIFTLEQCSNWFINSNPKWLIIQNRTIPVGYLRLNADNGETICIGSDIAQEHRRKGYARKAYKLLIDSLLEKGYLIIWLEVFEDNIAALSLYRSLGFIEVGKRLVRNKNYLRMVYAEV